jgi:hypothetical protein
MTWQELFASNPDLAAQYQSSGGTIPPQTWLTQTFTPYQLQSQFGYVQAADPTNPPTPQTTPTGPGVGTSALTPEQLQGAASQALINARNSNTASVQGANQTGAFTTEGLVNQQQVDTQNQTGTQNTNLNETTAGTQTGTQTGAQTQTQTGTTTGTQQQRVADTLGLGELVKGQTGQATQSDAARTGFLTDIMQTGGGQFNDQVQAAINNAMSGPGMQGVGNAAKGRVAGSAAANVARENLGQRLNASGQLAGPTATSNLVGAGVPLLGQDVSSSGSTFNVSDLVSSAQNAMSSTGAKNAAQTGTTTQNATGTSAQTSAESQAGTSAGNSNQFLLGEQPVAKTGGCYVSSILCLFGMTPKRVIQAAVNYKIHDPEFHYMRIGYSIYGPALARLALQSRIVRKLLQPVCRAILYEELRWAGRVSKFKPAPFTWHCLFHYGSELIGFFSSRKELVTRCPVMIRLLRNNNLLFTEN